MKVFLLIVLSRFAWLFVVIIFSLLSSAQERNDQLQRYPVLIYPPLQNEKQRQFLAELSRWKDSLKRELPESENSAENKLFSWQQQVFNILFLENTDVRLYRKNGTMDISQLLEKQEKDNGGVDAVILWAGYPQLGWDNRDQYFFYRNLPGGIKGLKLLAQQLHEKGKKLILAFNPWDKMPGVDAKKQMDLLVNLVRETDADGIFLDTISSVEGLRQSLDSLHAPVILQAEIPVPPEHLKEVNNSWMEPWGWSEEDFQREQPPLFRNTWLVQTHRMFHFLRWSYDQSLFMQNSWLNGGGMIIWENIFGTWVPLNERDRSFLRETRPVLHRYNQFFSEGKWTPFFPVQTEHVFASKWDLQNRSLVCLISRSEKEIPQCTLQMQHQRGVQYFNLTTGEKITAKLQNGKDKLSLSLLPRDMQAILVTTEKILTSGMKQFLSRQNDIRKLHRNEHKKEFPVTHLRELEETGRYSADQIPAGMIRIAVSPDSIEMIHRYRKRECGLYPGNGVTYHALEYDQLDKTGAVRKKIKLHPFAMDATPVTNNQYKKFLEKTGYRPADESNFLRHWVNGNPKKGEEEFPVTWITIDDARAYAKWMHKRLPTEEEWQWAAQNGKAETVWPWGNVFDSAFCNCDGRGNLTAVTAHKKGATQNGLLDLCGNAWQMTESERTDGHTKFIQVRGGSWFVNKSSGWYADQAPQPADWTAKYLLSTPGLDRCATVGFRCVVDLSNRD